MDGAARNPLSSPSTIEPASGLAPEGLQSGVDLDALGKLILIEEAILNRIDIGSNWGGYSAQSDRVRALNALRDEALGKEA